MPKIKYLTEDGTGKKLRRNVPKDLRGLAGKSAWVERISGTTADLREQANLFAVETDAKIKALRNQSVMSKGFEEVSASVAPGFKIHLSKTDTKRLALIHFRKVDEERVLHRAYVPGRLNSEDHAAMIADAAEDYRHAVSVAANETHPEDINLSSYAIQRALNLLIEDNFLSKNAVASKFVGRRKTNEVLVPPPELLVDPCFKLLCRYIEDAEVELAKRRLEALQTGQVPRVRNEFFLSAITEISPSSEQTQESKYTVGALITAFEGAKRDEVTSSRFAQYRIVTRSLTEELGGEFPLDQMDRLRCADLVELYLRIPSHAKQHYPKMTLRQAAKAFENKTGEPAQRYKAAQNNLAVLKSIFEYAVELDWLEKSPAEKVSVKIPRAEKKRQAQNKGYLPFTIAELQTIFQAPLYTGCLDDEAGFDKPGPSIIKRHRYWAPLISLWTGMRLNEVLQLETTDVLTSPLGIDYFEITDETEVAVANGVVEKRLKTENARRSVPIHSELIRLGFLEWVRTHPKGRIFPDAGVGSGEKLSDHFSKRFAYFLKKQGVWVPRKKVFHSFRGNFTDVLKSADVPLDMREAIMGWDNKGRMDGRYGSGFTIEALSTAMSRVTYVGLDLSHLYP